MHKLTYILKNTYNLNNKVLLSFITILLSSVILTNLVGCTDEVDYKQEKPAEGFTGITLCLPDLESAAEYGATRSDIPTRVETIELGKDEAEINDLYLLIFDKNGNQDVKNLKEMTSSDQDGYKVYNIELQEGEYKFYILGNLDKYISGGTEGLTSEDKIKNAVLNFADLANENILKPGLLPLACLASEMKDSPTAEEGSAETVKIVAGNSNKVYADLKFLCAKVRYTILFDQAKSTFKGKDVNFEDEVSAIEIRRETALTDEGQLTSPYYFDKLSDLELKKVEYPDDNSDYFKQDRTEIPDNLTGSWNDNDTKRAWQGIAYLPENALAENDINNERDKVTNLIFSGKGEEMKDSYNLPLSWENKETKEKYGIKRSNFYDVVVKLQNPNEVLNPEDLLITVSDWTLNNLSYQLHGPYELIVETTEIEKITSGEWTIMGFDSDIPDSQINFEFPTLKINGKDVPFFMAQVITDKIKDENGNNYDFGIDEWKSHFRITVNEDIPFSVLTSLNNGNKEYIDAAGVRHTLENLNYFHIVAGNIHKKIDVTKLSVDAFLTVTPLRITIDTRECYVSGIDTEEYIISFVTNYDDTNIGVDFTLYDPDGLFNGKGNGALTLSKCTGLDEIPGEENTYSIKVTNGELSLNIKDLIKGNSFWNMNNEFNLTFRLHIAQSNKTFEKTVIIIIKPFTTNYVIHFRDNTKEWDNPHIYVYQLLTLPSDLTNNYDVTTGRPDYSSGKHKYAGDIVGYIENNPTTGEQWNGAVQYVFTNNLSFKGWKGYGGPEINDPWETPVTGKDNPLTKGFVMFGNQTNNEPGHLEWNFKYAYTEYAWFEKYSRYNYDVNFNEDHENESYYGWVCEECKKLHDNGNDYNGPDDKRFYPGIIMEKETGENAGWWKYTLTGVAQPGRTMIIFGNGHTPWEQEYKDYGTDDFRYPGDYETAMPLFDFEDNEGWFLFNGNTTEEDQHFDDIKPTKVFPTVFSNAMASNLRIEFEKPDNFQRLDIICDEDWNNKLSPEIKENDGKYYVDVNLSQIIGKKYFKVQIFHTQNENSDWISKTYELYPKYFTSQNGKYVTVEPLRHNFAIGTPLYIKWNDHINLDDFFYTPPQNGCDFLTVYWTDWTGISCPTEKEYGNYKHVKLDLTGPTNKPEECDRQKLILRLCETEWDNQGYNKDLKVEDLPKYYNPVKKYYQINWHLLDPIKKK